MAFLTYRCKVNNFATRVGSYNVNDLIYVDETDSLAYGGFTNNVVDFLGWVDKIGDTPVATREELSDNFDATEKAQKIISYSFDAYHPEGPRWVKTPFSPTVNIENLIANIDGLEALQTTNNNLVQYLVEAIGDEGITIPDVGFVIMGKKGSNAKALVIDDADNLKVIATAGPNLNTSTLAIESGGNLQSIKSNTEARYAGGKLSYAEILTASDSIVPAVGKAITIYKLQVVPNSDNSSANAVTIKFVNKAWNLFKGYAGSFWEPFTGDVNEQIDITLANNQAVQILIHYKEV